MRKVFIVTCPDGSKLTFSTFNLMMDELRVKIGFEQTRDLVKEYRKSNPKPFTKSEFATFTFEVQGYKIETIELVSGSRWKQF